jgi:ATP-binding cassette subfamily C protein
VTQDILIKNGLVYYTEGEDYSYRIAEGTVLVYLIPEKDGEEGRRHFLGEFSAPFCIPGMRHSSDLLGNWVIGLVALDTARLTEFVDEDLEETRLSFAKAIGLKIASAEMFEEMLIERYELVLVKEQGAIIGTQQEQELTRERTLEIIAGVFKKKQFYGQGAAASTGMPLYDAAVAVCGREKIAIAPFDRVRETSGRRFSIEDVARVSHFVIRDIVLTEGWYRKDTGAFLAWREEDKAPVACIPKGIHSYLVYDPKTGKTEKITKEIAAGISPKACMFYRPFPEKPMHKMDLLSFGMEKVYRSDIVRLLLLALIGTLVGLLIPLMNEQAYDKFIPIGDAPGLIQLGAVMLACALGNISFTVVKNLASFRSMNSMKYAVQAATYDRLFNLPESFFRDYDAATLGQRAMGISTIYTVLSQSAVTAVLTALFSLLYLWRMFHYSTKLAIWGLVMLLAVAAIIVLLSIRQLRYERQMRDVDLETQSRAFQYIAGIAKIRNAWAEDRALYRYIEKLVDSQRINTVKERITIGVNALIETAKILFPLAFYFVMIRKSLDLSIGEFTAYTSAFSAFSAAILTLVQNLMVVNQIQPLYEDAKPILETVPEISEDAELPGDVLGEIELANVTFAYDTDRPPVIRDLDLHILPGEYVGIVGSSGCGKSTLLKLLLGFEKPQIGRIYYDGRDIDELDKRELRKKFGVVLQDGGLITGSITDNIRIAAPNIKIRRVEETVREVGLEEDIKQMPMGLHTVIAEGAATISGGQRQRILIARAIVAKPKLIFLDEATSALDNVTQSQIVDTLEKLDATKIVIAHRLSTVKNCDRIIVMDAGQIVEQGTYDELMEQKGLFYDLAIRQIS